jgi:hypothetical protein
MWQEEKENKRVDLPPKWTHAKFLEQLVYDMVFPQQTILHWNSLRDDDDSSRLLSSFGGLSSFQEDEDREWDFSNQRGIDIFLENKRQTKITAGYWQCVCTSF